MQICRGCLTLIREYPTFVEKNRKWIPSEPSQVICCDSPSPVEVDDGDLETYEENFEFLDFDDLTEKEETILEYLAKEGRIIYAEAEIREGQSSDTVVPDKQLWFDIL